MLHPDLIHSFTTQGDFHFVARNPWGERPSPAFAIASVALHRVQSETGLILSVDCGTEDLEDIYRRTSTTTVRRDLLIDAQIGCGLRDIGKQILKLDEQGQIQPPLAEVETEAIQRLVHVVTITEKRWPTLGGTHQNVSN
jgi:hypothetical protein